MAKKKTATPLSSLFGKCRRMLLYVAAFSLAINVLMLSVPLYSLQVLDRVISSASVETLVLLSVIMVVTICIFGLLSVIRSYTLAGLSEWLDRTLAPRLFSEAIVRSSLGVNTQASQYQRDLMSIKGFVSSGLTTLMDAPWSLIFLIVIYMINPILGFIAVIGLISLIAFGVINELATRKSLEQSTKLSINTQNLADIASRNAEAVESMGMMPNIVNHWLGAHIQSSDMQMRGVRRSHLIQSISRVIRLLVQISVTGFGGYLVLQNELSVGGMIGGSILVGRALAPFEGAIGVWRGYISAREAYDRLNEALEATQALERGTVDLPEPTGLLQVENLIFTPPNAKPIIKGISFTVQPGESLGIIGPSAAGKSTLSRLLVGLLPPSHGAVRLDGAETFKWKRADFGKYVGYLPQQVDLFPGNIKDNIARMDVNASMEDVIEAAKRANVHELILRLPQGYETDCGVANMSLSPGQRQRIGMARALYGNPKFIVLDEPNSNLDGEGERALLESLRYIKSAGITMVVIAHRPTIVAAVDTLLVLKGGTIERYGPREEILKQYVGQGQQGKPAGPQQVAG